MLKTLWRSHLVQNTLGAVLAGYLRFVRATSKIIHVDGEGAADEAVAAGEPLIITMWHGQHFMQTFFLKPSHRKTHVMISRHGDGGINAIAAEKLGMGIVRGSGAQRVDQVQKRGGAQALRALLGLLSKGENVSMTGDVPKISRVAGDGIVLLAQLSGRPVYPLAVVSSRRIDFPSWDAASIGLPFGRIAMKLGAPVYVDRDADVAGRAKARLAIEAGLDEVYREAYGVLGCVDPGAHRPTMLDARKHAATETH